MDNHTYNVGESLLIIEGGLTNDMAKIMISLSQLLAHSPPFLGVQIINVPTLTPLAGVRGV